MINQELVDKYKISLDLCNSNENLRKYTHLIRETLYKLLQPNYTATIDEVIWAECFINRERSKERVYETDEDDTAMVLKEFDDNDKSIYTDIDSFEDNTSPLIASRFIDNCRVVLITSNKSIQLYLTDSKENKRIIVNKVGSLNKRYKIAISNEIYSVIKMCSSKSELITQLRDQLDINCERSD